MAGNTVFVSGTLGYIPGSLKLVSDGLEEQTKQAFRNVIAILEAAGSSPSNGMFKLKLFYVHKIYNYSLKKPSYEIELV